MTKLPEEIELEIGTTCQKILDCLDPTFDKLSINITALGTAFNIICAIADVDEAQFSIHLDIIKNHYKQTYKNMCDAKLKSTHKNHD